jgi:ABC-type multidrug transport system ATPase subunit
MDIIAENIYKRFHETWIIRDFNFKFSSNKVYGIAGLNGSGKTTLLHILAGLTPPSKGKIKYFENEKPLADESWYQSICYAAPYADLYEYMNLEELIKHHLVFKKFSKNSSFDEFVQIVFLNGHEHKLIKMYSSGMKQRLKLGMSILSESKVLFLDEPQSNLDEHSKNWYRNLLMEYKKDRIVIIASNEAEDFRMVDERIELKTLMK